jgi:hypothetical protein
MDMGEMTHPSAAKIEGRSTFDKQMLNAFSIMFVPPSQQDHWKYRSMNRRTCQEIQP